MHDTWVVYLAESSRRWSGVGVGVAVAAAASQTTSRSLRSEGITKLIIYQHFTLSKSKELHSIPFHFQVCSSVGAIQTSEALPPLCST